MLRGLGLSGGLATWSVLSPFVLCPWRMEFLAHGRDRKQVVVVDVQLPRSVQLFVTPRTAAHQDFLSFTISWSLLRFRSIESVVLSNHLSADMSVT